MIKYIDFGNNTGAYTDLFDVVEKLCNDLLHDKDNKQENTECKKCDKCCDNVCDNVCNNSKSDTSDLKYKLMKEYNAFVEEEERKNINDRIDKLRAYIIRKVEDILYATTNKIYKIEKTDGRVNVTFGINFNSNDYDFIKKYSEILNVVMNTLKEKHNFADVFMSFDQGVGNTNIFVCIYLN